MSHYRSGSRLLCTRMELSQLPPELLSQGIFKFLSAAQLLRSESVCKWWAQLCREPTLWHYLCIRDFGVTSDSETDPTLSSDMEKVAREHFSCHIFATQTYSLHLRWQNNLDGEQPTRSSLLFIGLLNFAAMTLRFWEMEGLRQ